MHSPEHTLPFQASPSSEGLAPNRRAAGRPWLLWLCLLACAVLTVVSLQQARHSAWLAALPQADSAAVDLAQPARQAMRLIEQSRGLEALHLLQHTEVRKHALALQLRQYRHELDALLARSAEQAQTRDAPAAALLVALRADTAEYAALQDQMLGLSRQALTEPAAAGRAQQVLTGPSQAVFERLHAGLDRWWTLSESHARQQRQSIQLQQAQATKGWQALAIAGAMAAVAAWVLQTLGGRQPTRQVRDRSEPMASPEPQALSVPALLTWSESGVDAAVSPSRMQAIGAAVTSWRHDNTAALPWPALTR